jgi:hypothetical protein
MAERVMVSWKAGSLVLLFFGLLGGFKYLFDLIEKKRRRKR